MVTKCAIEAHGHLAFQLVPLQGFAIGIKRGGGVRGKTTSQVRDRG